MPEQVSGRESQSLNATREQVATVLDDFLRASTDEWEALRASVSGESYLSRPELAQRVRGAIPRMSMAVARNFTALIAALAAQALDKTEGPDEFRQRTRRAVERIIEDTDPTSRPEDLTLVTDTLVDLAGSLAFQAAGQVGLTAFDYPRVLDSARINTDLRPVFGVSGTTSGPVPVAYMVNHTMKVTYQTDGEDSESSIYISLDDDDLEQLATQLVAAQERARALHNALGASGMAVVSPRSGRVLNESHDSPDQDDLRSGAVNG